MLWKKESAKSDAVFVDICKFNGSYKIPFLEEEMPSITEKSDEIASQIRVLGNNFYNQGEWSNAIEMYNMSLCYASPQSNRFTMALTSRSICFFNMQRYNECLNDIRLVRKADPNNFIIRDREAICLQHITEAASSPTAFDVMADFEPNEHFPCMSNKLKVQHSDGKRSVVAIENIDVGKTVLVEEPYITSLYIRTGSKCNICLKDKTKANLMPCDKCNAAMFCSDKCQNHFYHKIECGMRYCKDNFINGLAMDLVRSILKAITLFPNVDKLMDFVEKTVNSNNNDLSSSLTDDQSKYRAFLTLDMCTNIFDEEGFRPVFATKYEFLLTIPKIRLMFQSKNQRRFLMHLLCHHALILQYHSLRASSEMHWNLMKTSHRVNNNSFVGLTTEFFAHSCAPNLLLFHCDAKMICITVRPIKKGEPLTVSRLTLPSLSEETSVRQKIIEEACDYICKCSRCQGAAAVPAQRNQIRSDPDFQYIISNTIRGTDEEKLKNLNNKCINLMKKYGEMLWCNEFGYIMDCYRILSIKRMGN